MCDILSNVSLRKWAEKNPGTNPFTNCANVARFGGADFLWTEFQYRYNNKEVFYPNDFVSAVERVFLFNQYKFLSLLETTQANYDMFTNYQVEKIGSEIDTKDLSRAHSGTDSLTRNMTETERPAEIIDRVTTPTTEITETETPALTTTETSTPRVVETSTRTPNTQSETTDTPRVSTTTEVTPLGYSDSMSRTTYDDANHKPVEMTVHTPSSGSEVTTVTPTSGTNTSVTVTTGTEQTQTSRTGEDTKETETTGTNTKVSAYTDGNITERESHSGTNTTTTTGTDGKTYSSQTDDTGTDVLSFQNRMDKGFMYRPPQDAIKDERSIAMFSLVDIILKDVEAATLISVY